MKTHIETHHLQDTQQSVWQLTAIQLGGWTSLPILATSVLILQENSFYGSILTIVVGNAILWFIRLGIILMSHKKRQSTLDISQDYLGHFGSYFIATLLLIATLFWFIAQTTAASNTLTHLVNIKEHPSINQFVQMSVLLGIVSTFLCMEGIIVLRKLCVLILPVILLSFCIIIFTVPFKIPAQPTASLSLSGLSLVLGSSLGITSDMPTFFRHSKSLHTSIMALTLVQIVSLAIGLGSLFFGSIITGSFDVDVDKVLLSNNDLLRISLIVFLFCTAICANVANVYSASVGWELLAPKSLVGRKEYLILGLGLTTIFIMIPSDIAAKFLLIALEVADGSLVSLCLVLIIGYLLNRQKSKQLPKTFDQHSYFLAWLFASIVTGYLYMSHGSHSYSPLTAGFITIVVTLLAAFTLKRIYHKRA